MIGQMAATNTLLQTIVPDELRGRIMALYAMSIAGLAPVGGLLMGAAADVVGAPWALAAGGTIVLATAGWFAAIRGGTRGALTPTIPRLPLRSSR